MPPLTTRPSEARWAVFCAGYHNLKRHISPSTSKAAWTGKALHRAFGHAVQGNFEAALEATPKPVRWQLWNGIRMWRDGDKDQGIHPLRVFFSEPQVELEMRHYGITGTADLVQFPAFENGHTLTVLDWKSGQIEDENEWQQIQSYIYLALHTLAKLGIDPPKKIVGIIARTHEGLWESRHFFRDEIEYHGHCQQVNLRAARAALAAEESEKIAELTRGPHCKWCPCAGICPALEKDLIPFQRGEFGRLTRGQLWDALGAMERLCGKAREALKAKVVEAGSIDLGDGRQLEVKIRPRRYLCDVTVTQLRALGIDDDTIDAGTKISLNQMESAEATRAGKGNGAAAKRRLEALLKKNNLITTIDVVSVVETNPKEEERKCVQQLSKKKPRGRSRQPRARSRSGRRR